MTDTSDDSADAGYTSADQTGATSLLNRYRGMLAREAKYRRTIAGLEQESARRAARIRELERRLAELDQQLQQTRSSWRFRIGSLIVLPVSLLRRWAHPRASGAPQIPSAHPPTGVPQRAPAATLPELEARWRASPTLDHAAAYASALYYQHGAIRLAHEVLCPHAASASPGKHRQLLVTLGGLLRLMDRPLHVPPRQQGANLLPARDAVLYCVHSAMPYLTNGYSTRTQGVAAGAVANGMQMQVIARPGFPWDTKSASQVDAPRGRTCSVHDGVSYVFTPGPMLEAEALDRYIAVAADTFAREAVRHRAGTIHAASNHITGLAALLAARRLGLPFVYEVRGLWEVTQAAGRSDWERTDRFRLAEQLETMVAREADQVLAITPELKAELVRRGVEADRIGLLPNCVDIDEFSPIERDDALMRRLGLDPAVPTIGFAGSVVAYEGLELLVRALARLAARQVPFNLLVVGDGAALSAVKRAADEAGILARCAFPGRVARDQVRDLISCMDIMPCPRTASAVTEMVSPLKPLEAMAMGKAVLLSDVSPHLEFAGPDESRAVLFRKDDVDDLADKLAALMSDAGRRSALGRAARLWVAQNRTWHHAGKLLGQAYAQARSTHARLLAGDNEAARPLPSLHLALIADRFTTDSLGPELTVHRPTPDDWRDLLADRPIDALLVESAWEGNGGAWTRRVGHYSEDESRPLRELVAHCRQRGIPTLFWNKEDPVHFARFQKTAALFDHVFTTDAGCIGRYLATPGADTLTVSSLAFFAQPRIHNPVPSTRPWVHDVCYAGSYYGERYAQRSERLRTLLDAAPAGQLTIYDRQHFKPDSPYRFPEELAPFVRGGLDYADMVQAYKAHAVQINVNSVEDSPTMFSRRVVEIAASGTALLSSAGRGVDETLAGTVRTAHTQEEAKRWLATWLQDEFARHQAILPPMREVFRAHTAAHRLVQMLRTAGVRVAAPGRPSYALRCDDWAGDVADAVARQTVWPRLVLARRISSPVPAGLTVTADEGGTALGEVASEGGLWWGSLSPAVAQGLGEAHYEDLVTCASWSGAAAVGYRSIEAGALEPGQPVPMVCLDQAVDSDGGLIHGSGGPTPPTVGFGVQRGGVLLARLHAATEPEGHKPPASAATVLVAGHDLKFLRGVIDRWTRDGHRVLIDEWQGHSQHDETRSAELLAQADVVFCEWCLGNAAWYSRHKLPHQRLVVRFHAQELRSAITSKVAFGAVDRLVFVGAHVRDAAIRRFDICLEQTVVIPNYVRPELLEAPLPRHLAPSLGLVGITPRMKRLDLALDLLVRLRQSDPDMRLLIKGKRPEEYAWMRSRPDELAYYAAQDQRIGQEPALQGAVVFEPFGDDMAEFYGRTGFVLSVSDHESFHLTLADGAAAGAVPVSLDWEGADRIYPAHWLCGSVDAMAARVRQVRGLDAPALEALRRENRDHVRRHFSLDSVMSRLDVACGLATEPTGAAT